MPQTVLVVEDSIVHQVLLTKILTKQHYKVLLAESGEQVFEIIEQTLPDLIILDILLPGMDGYAVCKNLKDSKKTAAIPVIFISSLNTTKNILKGFETGGVDYITKPFTAAEVIVRIGTHLRLHNLQNKLEEQNIQLDAEKQKAKDLLCHVLPVSIAQELLETGKCVPQLFPDATVCFVDIVGFTAASALLSPEKLVCELNDIFTSFDQISRENGCERIKTMGDAFLFVSGVPEPDSNHAVNIARAAIEMINWLTDRNQESAYHWQIRVGINTGSVVGGIVGTEKYLYDIFGDTVNLAARLEKSASPMGINVSNTSYTLLKDSFPFTDGEHIHMKGKGNQLIYTLRCDV